MGFFSSIGNAIKGVGHFAGKVLSNPIVEGASAFIPGVGPLITAGEGALGGLLKPGGNLGQAAMGGIQGAAAGAAGGAVRKLGTGILSNGLGSTLKSAMLGGALKPSGTFAPSSDGGSGGEYGNIIDYDAGGNPIYAGDQQGGGSWTDALLGGARKLGSGLLNGAAPGGGMGGLGNLAIGGLAGYQALNAANASKRAGQLSDKAIGLAESRWNDAAPLRTAGQARLLNPTRPDLTSVYQDPTNPFAARPLAAPGTPAAPSIQSLTQAPGGVLRKLQLARGN